MFDIKEIIAALPEPTIFATVNVEDVIQSNIDLMKSLNPDWVPMESDSNMLQIEAFSYKEVMLRNMFNGAIKKMLPHYSQKADLDNFAFAFYGGETRLEGVEPTALYEFEIESILSVDVVIPKGLSLSDGQGNNAYLDENVTISAGALKASGPVKLDIKTKISTIKTELVVSPYPYVLKAVALADFAGGTDPETDEEFFARAILSLYKYSTAGGKGAYEYFAYSADERVFDVAIISLAPREVDVIVLAHEGITQTVANVNTALTNDEKIQAFCDVVNVSAATAKGVTIDATIHVFDLLKQSDITTSINENFTNKFKIGESLPYSSIMAKMHLGGVYKVVLAGTSDITTLSNEYIKIDAINFSFVEAVL